MKKYELTNDTLNFDGKILHRIRALVDFNTIKAEDIGGYIEKEGNLSQEGLAWVHPYAKVYDEARVCDNAEISGNACVFGNSAVYGAAQVCGNCKVYGNSIVAGNAYISEYAEVYDRAIVIGYAKICGFAKVYNKAEITNDVKIGEYAEVYGDATISGDAKLQGRAKAYGAAKIFGNVEIYDNAEICGDACIGDDEVITGNTKMDGKTIINAQISHSSRFWIRDPKSNPEHFINHFMGHATAPAEHSEQSYELFRAHFRAGYCWHFAHILKAVFNRGEVCWAAPFGHMVWCDDDGTPYDIEGKYDGEAYYFIPESYLGRYVDSYQHIHGMCDHSVPEPTKEELKSIITKYCADTGEEYIPDIEKYFKEDNKNEDESNFNDIDSPTSLF